uniref:Uncharacterized protein n=1 Tax=Stomoxys calcitrans TaxID=35570 RepID=A0A1I8P2Y3_STOCA
MACSLTSLAPQRSKSCPARLSCRDLEWERMGYQVATTANAMADTKYIPQQGQQYDENMYPTQGYCNYAAAKEHLWPNASFWCECRPPFAKRGCVECQKAEQQQSKGIMNNQEYWYRKNGHRYAEEDSPEEFLVIHDLQGESGNSDNDSYCSAYEDWVEEAAEEFEDNSFIHASEELLYRGLTKPGLYGGENLICRECNLCLGHIRESYIPASFCYQKSSSCKDFCYNRRPLGSQKNLRSKKTESQSERPYMALCTSLGGTFDDDRHFKRNENNMPWLFNKETLKCCPMTEYELPSNIPEKNVSHYCCSCRGLEEPRVMASTEIEENVKHFCSCCRSFEEPILMTSTGEEVSDICMINTLNNYSSKNNGEYQTEVDASNERMSQRSFRRKYSPSSGKSRSCYNSPHGKMVKQEQVVNSIKPGSHACYPQCPTELVSSNYVKNREYNHCGRTDMKNLSSDVQSLCNRRCYCPAYEQHCHCQQKSCGENLEYKPLKRSDLILKNRCSYSSKHQLVCDSDVYYHQCQQDYSNTPSEMKTDLKHLSNKSQNNCHCPRDSQCFVSSTNDPKASKNTLKEEYQHYKLHKRTDSKNGYGNAEKHTDHIPPNKIGHSRHENQYQSQVFKAETSHFPSSHQNFKKLPEKRYEQMSVRHTPRKNPPKIFNYCHNRKLCPGTENKSDLNKTFSPREQHANNVRNPSRQPLNRHKTKLSSAVSKDSKKSLSMAFPSDSANIRNHNSATNSLNPISHSYLSPAPPAFSRDILIKASGFLQNSWEKFLKCCSEMFYMHDNYTKECDGKLRTLPQSLEIQGATVKSSSTDDHDPNSTQYSICCICSGVISNRNFTPPSQASCATLKDFYSSEKVINTCNFPSPQPECENRKPCSQFVDQSLLLCDTRKFDGPLVSPLYCKYVEIKPQIYCGSNERYCQETKLCDALTTSTTSQNQKDQQNFSSNGEETLVREEQEEKLIPIIDEAGQNKFVRGISSASNYSMISQVIIQ